MENLFKPAVVVVGTALAMTACAGKARVGDVWSRKRIETISAADRDLFVTDRASRLRVTTQQFPLADQRQEFSVTWRGSDVRIVMFEYRQANVPDNVTIQTIPAVGHRSNLFEIRGDEFHNGGPVSAWRVSLWNGEQLLDEKKSSLW